MRYLVVLVLVFLMLIPASANEIKLKSGGTVYLMKNASPTIYEELSYEARKGKWGIEGSVGHYATSLWGEEFTGYKYYYEKCKAHEGAKLYGNNQKRGKLTSFPLGILFKRYFGKAYIGAGGGYQYLSFKENYEGEASVKNSGFFQGAVGYNITKHLGIEAKFMMSDLDIESGTENIGIAEDHSRLEMIVLQLVGRW